MFLLLCVIIETKYVAHKYGKSVRVGEKHKKAQYHILSQFDQLLCDYIFCSSLRLGWSVLVGKISCGETRCTSVLCRFCQVSWCQAPLVEMLAVLEI